MACLSEHERYPAACACGRQRDVALLPADAPPVIVYRAGIRVEMPMSTVRMRDLAAALTRICGCGADIRPQSRPGTAEGH